jgi:plastocyanin
MKLSRKWFVLAGATLALGAAMPAATAFAKNGDDDPPGHVRHGGDDARRHLSAAAATTASTKLVGTVGKGGSFTITLTARGQSVRTLKAGTYTVVVHDDSAIHNFELEREHGWERELTDVSAVGTKTVRLKLTRGTYKAFCDPHESTMFQRFTVR